MGDALPEGIVLELGEGYLFETSNATGDDGSEGDWDKTERGEQGGDEGGDEGGDDVRKVVILIAGRRCRNCGKETSSGRAREWERKQGDHRS
jgi:hypothetical protein